MNIRSKITGAAMMYRYSMALTWAFDYGIIKALTHGPKSVSVISDETGIPAHRTGAILDVLCGLDLLSFDRERSEFSFHAADNATAVAEYDLLADEVVIWKQQMADWFQRDLRTPATAEDKMFSSGEELVEYLRVVRDANAAHAESIAVALKDRFPCSQFSSFLDLGGGHARYAIEVKKSRPGADVEVLDLPQTINASLALNEGEDILSRITMTKGDALALERNNPKYTAIMVNDLLHGFSRQQKETVVQSCYDLLLPGGVLLLSKFDHETGEDRNRSSLMSLKMSIQSNGGYLESNAEAEGLLVASGFELEAALREHPSKITFVARKQ